MDSTPLEPSLRYVIAASERAELWLVLDEGKRQ